MIIDNIIVYFMSHVIYCHNRIRNVHVTYPFSKISISLSLFLPEFLSSLSKVSTQIIANLCYQALIITKCKRCTDLAISLKSSFSFLFVDKCVPVMKYLHCKICKCVFLERVKTIIKVCRRIVRLFSVQIFFLAAKCFDYILLLKISLYIKDYM